MQDDMRDLIRAVLGMRLPADDKDFTPDLARTVINLYRNALIRVLSQMDAETQKQ